MIQGAIGQLVRRTADSEVPQRLAIPVGLALATFGAATPWLHAFRVPTQDLLLVAASVTPVTVTAIVAGLYRRPPAASYGISAGLLILVLLAASGLHAGPLLSQLSKVPDRLLAETLPLNGTPILLSPVVMITWLSGAVSAELVYRTRARSAVGDLALAVPAAFFVLAYAVAAGAPSRDRLGGALVFLGAATVAVIRQDQRSSWTVASPSSPETVTSRTLLDPRAIPVTRRTVLVRSIAAAVGLAVVLTASLPSIGGLSGTPATLNRPAPVAASVIIDPVGATAALRDGDPKSRPFRVVAVDTDQRSPGYFASAILDEFDGSQWSFDATFKPTGGRVPAREGTAPVVAGEYLKASETVESTLPSGLLPVADRAVSVSGAPVAVDAVTGMVLPVSPRDGTTFNVASRVPELALAGVPSVDGIGAPAASASGAPSADVAIPPDSTTAMAAAERFVARLAGTRPAPTVAFLQRLLAALRSQERHLTPYAPAASPKPTGSAGSTGAPAATPPSSTPSGPAVAHLGGTSLSEVINAVTVDRSATPEQFATFFALIARYLGVPARLATGFRLASGSSGVALPAGLHGADNRQAWTWVEIPVSGLGWVVADPTPDALTGVAAPPPEQAGSVPTTLPTNKANAVPKNATTGAHAVARPYRPPRRGAGGFPAWGYGLTALPAFLLLLGAWPAAAALRRQLRSRNRRSDDAAALAVGAWLELLDGLDRAGMPIEPSSTGAEVADEASGHFGGTVGPRVLRIAEVADRGLYSRSKPPPFEDSQRVWDDQRELTHDIIRQLDRRQRARALITVGSGSKRPHDLTPSR